LSAVLRRISNGSPTPAAAPEEPLFVGDGLLLFGFEEPVAQAAEAPLEPAAEDIVALLAEQPEVAPLVDVHLTAVEEARAAPPASEPMSEFPPEPEPEPEAEPEPEPEPEPPRFASLQPEQPPSRPQALGARFTSRVAPRPVRPAVSWHPPEPAHPAAVQLSPPAPHVQPPHSPTEAPPHSPTEAPPHSPTEAPHQAVPSPAPAMDRVGRQSQPRNRRLYRRVTLGAELEINGSRCSLIDVSIGGFAATGAAGTPANAIVPVILRLTIDGIEVGTRLNARIVYVNRERASGRFIDLTASQTAFLRYIVTWRGESVGTVGTTTLLDAITAGPDHGFPPKSSDGPRERWWYGMIGRKVKPPR
jgi:hypothetical protein